MWRKLWFDERTENVIRKLIRTGVVRFNMDTGLLEPNTQGNYDTNWMFFGSTVGSRDCYLWHTIMFDYFNLVPRFCRFDCYKVVVKPRNVRELIQFAGLMHAMPYFYGFITQVHGKCGIDTRHYTESPYDAFIYCNNVEEGREKCDITRDACDKYLPDGENIPVILKRSCTEFERALGPTDKDCWQSMTPEEMDLELKISDIFKGQSSHSNQPDWLRNKIVHHWLKFANTYGDKTGTELTGRDDTVHAVTYHLEKGGETATLPQEVAPRKRAAKRRKRDVKGKFTKTGGK